MARTVEIAALELRGTLDARRGDSGWRRGHAHRALRLERRLRAVGPAAFSRPPVRRWPASRLRSGREEKALELALERAGERPGCGHACLLVAEVHVACEGHVRSGRDFAVVLDCGATRIRTCRACSARAASRGPGRLGEEAAAPANVIHLRALENVSC